MPNWCENTVHFEHIDPKAIIKVKEAFKEEKLCNYFLPISEDTEDWYMSRVSKWGTKWDVEATPEILDNWEDEDKNKYISFHVYCETAWSPPMEFIESVSKIYKVVEVEISFEEPGMDVAGSSKYINGECVFEESRPCMCHECDVPLNECEGDCE